MLGTDITQDALNILGIAYAGQTVSPEVQTISQLHLNNMLGEWSAQGLAIFSVVRNQFNLSSGVADYVIGPGGIGQFGAVARPEKIEAWSVNSGSGMSNGGKPVDQETFVAVAKDRSATGSRIEALNYDANYPAGTIHLYPIPNGGILELWVWEEFSPITDFTQPILLPPGYLKAVTYSLAIDLAPIFGRPIDPNLQNIVDGAKRTLGMTNISEQTRTPPPAQAAR